MSESEKKEVRQQAEQAGSEKLQILLNFLINREQDLRFTSSPRLILETTMIKLCHLGDYLSFGDLLEKIGALENKLLTAAVSNEQIKVDHIADPAVPWISDSQKEVKVIHEESSVIAHDNDCKNNDWDGFLDYLKSKSRPMFNVLKDWEFLNLAEETLEIAKGNQSFSASFFDDKDRYEQLSSFCRDFFHRDIRIKILSSNNRVPKTKPTPKVTPAEADVAGNTDLPSPVRDILNVFQGEIKKRGPK